MDTLVLKANQVKEYAKSSISPPSVDFDSNDAKIRTLQLPQLHNDNQNSNGGSIMKTSFLTGSLGALALSCTSAGMAATVTLVPSTLSPIAGDQFTLTLQADVPNTLAATMNMSFNASAVAFVSGAVTGLFTGAFVKNNPPDQNPTVFDIDAPTSTGANPGTYNAAILTFKAIAAGPANIVINDDGGILTGWFDTPDANHIPVDYIQANINVQAIPLPAAAWLIAPAVLATGRFSRRRKAA